MFTNMDDNVKNFKCCKNKKFNDLVCVECLSVYHPSCIERKSYYKVLNQHKIYCSSKCEKDFIEKEQIIEKLQEELEILRKENKSLKHVRKKSQSTKTVNEDSDEKSEVYNLKKKLQDLKETNKILEQERLTYMDESLEVRQKLENLQEIKEEMLNSIRTLEMDNEVYKKEVQDLKNFLSKEDPKENPTKQSTINKKHIPKNKILLLSDNLGSGLFIL